MPFDSRLNDYAAKCAEAELKAAQAKDPRVEQHWLKVADRYRALQRR